MKLETMVLSGNTSFLFKGSYGFGKTIAAASFARLGPVFLAYWDKKQPVELMHFFRKHAPELLKNIEYEVYGAHNANEYLNLMIKLGRDCRYVAFINDSVTTMTSAAVNWSLGFKSTKKVRDESNIAIPDFDEYKVETSLVTQALDISRTLPCHIIWTAHPLPSMKIEGSGPSMKVSKTNPIVTYGSKVAGIIPGQFSEIYQFSKLSSWDQNLGKSTTKYIVSTEQVGDDYAKSNIGLNVEIDITNRLFFDAWKTEVAKLEVVINEVKEQPKPDNPFSNLITPTNPKTDKKPWEK